MYICLHKPETASTAQVLNYVSKLYSKVWNEAAMKNIFDIQCCVVSDSLEGIVSRDEILKLPNNFFIGSRIISNIAFPKKKINEEVQQDRLLDTHVFHKNWLNSK